MTRVARTPSSFRSVAAPETLAQLEFDRVLSLVAGHAVSELGAKAVQTRRPRDSLQETRDELAAVAELARVLDELGQFAPEPVPDLAELLQTLGTQGSVLDGAELAMLEIALEAMRKVATALRGLGENAPRVSALRVEIPPRRLEEAIGRAIEPDGRVKDDASPELRRARRRLRETRSQLVTLLERYLRELAPHQTVADPEVTVRNGRYVVPVRREARGGIGGIVHGESSSGATLFVEPAEVVELGNALNACEAEEARARLAVLRTLTEQARPVAGRIEDGWSMCVRVDDLYARACYALRNDAYLPRLEPSPAQLEIRQGRHPLIVTESGDAVPFDLVLSPEACTVVVSGPNAGGKTVLIKAVGLISALAQAGVIPPVGPGTLLPVFKHIFSDIGDHQSIAASLSTFSAHIAALRAILLNADETSLVLLDELGTGTDPVEGGALAGATILSLTGRGSVTVATTHLHQLKEIAAETSGVVNASLEFDAETLTPTYRLHQGKPGRSYGLAIARRLGLPDAVLAAAEELTPEGARSVDAMLAQLEERETELTRREEDVTAAQARLARETDAVIREQRDLETRLAALEERERELERSGREQARQFLLEARRRVEEALGLARAAVTEATAKEARRLVEEGVRAEAEAIQQLEKSAKGKGWKIKGSGERGAGLVGEPEAPLRQERTAPRSPLPAPQS
ncbi:MAG: hypothetical protein GTN62_10970, partial [Gemmatimonadales bacterium]|nr:hypothetical protein [Gemmatimonadales bacterium]NIN12202.1 hypothetical protein [Gemmatimonadales bacterium]NIN50617.1 hypothetical protein [Gemmatimonadales bacterium]NIP08081.1 hypothetical protein [Gemmatimonadales bacterium]NIR03371.1 hypothetical protein [Gemmatimonadales bacterium]